MAKIKNMAIVLIVLGMIVLASSSVFAAELDTVTYANSKITVEGTCNGNQAQVAIFNSDGEPVYFTTVEVEDGEFNSILPADFDFEVGETYTVKVADYDGTEVSTETFVVEETTYTVTFNTNGGSAVASQTITSGETATSPTDPTKENFVFGGWYVDSTLTTEFDFDTPITATTTIYAKWNEIPTEKTINKTEDNVTVSALGMFTGNPVLTITENETGDNGYNSLITLVKEDEEIIGSYDISIAEGDFIGDLTLTFTVGKQYEGDTIKVYHKLASGEVETKTAIVKDGKITIIVNELSPFMLTANKEVLSKKDETPKTGDNVYIYAVLMVTAICGIFAASKLMKKSR